MTLESILENREPGATKRAHHWYSYCWEDANGACIVNVIHHFTEMIQFKAMIPSKPYFPVPVRHVMHVDLGQGSKSDQDGMNRIFRKLGLPWYYARDKKYGGPRILRLMNPAEEKQLPRYLRDRKTRINVYGYIA